MKKLILILILVLTFSGCSSEKVEEDFHSEEVSPQKEAVSEEEVITEEIVTEKPVSRAMKIVLEMSTEEKVGQLFLARCPDINAVSDVIEYKLGGYILFARDFKTFSPEEVYLNIGSYQNVSKIPMLIAVDEEGGTVCRVSRYSQFRANAFPSPRYLYNKGGMELISETEREKCKLLRSLGVNVNMAPVCDITTDRNAFMYSRSLGKSPEETGKFVSTVTGIMKKNGIGSVLKHFPGYGNNVDTHTGIAIDNRSLEELENGDLIPFRMGIESGCGAILVSHTFINCIDTEYPASLSVPVHDYLRNEMNFNGVIVTDDLIMEAITDIYGAEEAAILAVLAGNDLLCSSEYKIQYKAVLDAVKNGRIPEEIINKAAERVIEWKIETRIIPTNGR